MPGCAHTVLVELRARLRRSADPDRIFRVTTQLARQLGLVGVRRVLDSAPLLDAVATHDTVSLVRGGIRGLRVLPGQLAAQVRAGRQRDDDYAAPGKPACDWDDPAAREELVDSLFRDGYRALFALRGAQLRPDAAQAAGLLATVIGQDIDETSDGRFVIAEGAAPDRVISLVDPQARHGHKTTAHALTATRATSPATPTARSSPPRMSAPPTAQMQPWRRRCWPTCPHPGPTASLPPRRPPCRQDSHLPRQAHRGDHSALGWGRAGPLRRACQGCPLAAQCTTSRAGRTISIHRHEALLAQARAWQEDPAWWADYRTTRPKVERKLAHLLRRRHGGRRARVRGLLRVGQDFRLLAAAVNLARLATLGIGYRSSGWAVAPA
jgi:Transposase DDE domain